MKVFFAEASKSTTDFLFNILCLPIGTVVRLLNNNDMVGSLSNLYQSVQNLDETYLQEDLDKNVLLKPKVLISSKETSGLLPSYHDDTNDNLGTSFYMCPAYCSSDMTCDIKTQCHYCKRDMHREMRYESNSIKRGFVKENVTFMVMNDLAIQPMSTISSITLLKNLKIKDFSTLQEKVVQLGMDEGIKLLKASLQSKMVLTSVFLIKKEY